MTVRRTRACVLAALCTSILAAAPAHAAPVPIVATGSFARTVPFIDGSIYVFECDASAPGASVTRIDSCVLSDGVEHLTAPPVTQNGPAAQTTGAYSLDSYQWQLCWTASATYPDGSTQSASGCTGTSSLAGVG
jgi:hypothetical protein